MKLICSEPVIYELTDEDYDALKQSKPKKKKHSGYVPLGRFIYRCMAIDNRAGYCNEIPLNRSMDALQYLKDLG